VGELIERLLRRGAKDRPKSVHLTLERVDGALIELDFDPENLESIARLFESMRDPVVMAKRLEEAERSRDYWQDRCLEAER